MAFKSAIHGKSTRRMDFHLHYVLRFNLNSTRVGFEEMTVDRKENSFLSVLSLVDMEPLTMALRLSATALYICAASKSLRNGHRRYCSLRYGHSDYPSRASVTRHSSRSTCHDANVIHISEYIRGRIATEPHGYRTSDCSLQQSKGASLNPSVRSTCSMFHHQYHAANQTMKRRW